MIVLIPYINSLNLSWIIVALFLRNMEPLNQLKGENDHRKDLLCKALTGGGKTITRTTSIGVTMRIQSNLYIHHIWLAPRADCTGWFGF